MGGEDERLPGETSGETSASTSGEAPGAPAPSGLAYEQARLAYTIIQALLEHTRQDVEKFAEVWTRLAEELNPTGEN